MKFTSPFFSASLAAAAISAIFTNHCGLIHRLYGCLTSVVGSYVVNVIHYFYKKAKLLEILYHGFSCLVAVHAGVFAALVVHGSVIV